MQHRVVFFVTVLLMLGCGQAGPSGPQLYSGEMSDPSTLVFSTPAGGYDLPQPSSVIGHWQMNESSWPTGAINQVTDSSGLENNGTAFGGAVITLAGFEENAGRFDGSTGFVAVPKQIQTSESYSVAAWIHPASLNRWQAFASKDGSNASPFSILISNANKIEFRLGKSDVSSGSALVKLTSATSATIGGWMHVVAVFNKTKNKAYLYINGLKEAEGSFSSAWSSAGPFVIGAGLWNSTRTDYFKGEIDQVIAWRSALTDADALALYQAYDVDPPPTTSQLSFTTIPLAPPNASSTAVGDFDGDGLNDIAVLEGGKHHRAVRILAWLEAPTWIKHEFNSSYVSLPFTGSSMAVDIDDDGDTDLVFSEDMHSGSTKKANLVYFENPGRANATSQNWPVHIIKHWGQADNVEHINDMAVKDVDSNGKKDIVIRHLGSYAVEIAFQMKNGTWVVRKLSLPSNRSREGLCLGDLDRDGNIDIVLNGYWLAAPADPISGSFSEHIINSSFFSQSRAAGADPLNNSSKCAVGDLNGDAYPDVVMTTAEGDPGKIAWYAGNSKPRSQAWTQHLLENNLMTGFHQAVIVDMDGDGLNDIVTGRGFGQTGIYIYKRGNLAGTSFNKITVTNAQGLYSGVVADLNGDHKLDIVGPNNYTGKMFLYQQK
jgi:hypothetical protein